MPSISAASILAKTTRDALMRDLDHRYPGFSLSGHKGYPTPAHVAALNALGPSPLHRRSFAPVRVSDCLEEADFSQYVCYLTDAAASAAFSDVGRSP